MFFSQLHKNKAKLHSFSAVEVYKNADGSCGFLMYFIFSSLSSIKLDNQCNRVNAREVTRKETGLVVLPTTELPLNAPLLTPQHPTNSVTLCMSGAGGGSHTAVNVSSLNECKWREGDAQEAKKYFNLCRHAG